MAEIRAAPATQADVSNSVVLINSNVLAQVGPLKSELSSKTSEIAGKLTDIRDLIERLAVLVRNNASAPTGARQTVDLSKDAQTALSVLQDSLRDFKRLTSSNETKLSALDERLSQYTSALATKATPTNPHPDSPPAIPLELSQAILGLPSAFASLNSSVTNLEKSKDSGRGREMQIEMLVAVGFLSMLSLAVFWYSGRQSRAAMEKIGEFGLTMKAEIEKIKKESELSGLAAAKSQRIDTPAGPLLEIETRLRELLERIGSSNIGELTNENKLLAAQVEELKQKTEGLGLAVEEFSGALKLFKDQAEDQAREHAEEEAKRMAVLENERLGDFAKELRAIDACLWPEPFLDAGPLAGARDTLWKSAKAGDLHATGLVLALGGMRLALIEFNANPHALVDALDRVGESAYKLWKITLEDNPMASLEEARMWGDALNKFMEKNELPVSIRIVTPKSNFDPSNMVSVRSATGTTFRVREPLSWIIIGKKGDQLQVLANGRVVTE